MGFHKRLVCLTLSVGLAACVRDKSSANDVSIAISVPFAVGGTVDVIDPHSGDNYGRVALDDTGAAHVTASEKGSGDFVLQLSDVSLLELATGATLDGETMWQIPVLDVGGNESVVASPWKHTAWMAGAADPAAYVL